MYLFPESPEGTPADRVNRPKGWTMKRITAVNHERVSERMLSGRRGPGVGKRVQRSENSSMFIKVSGSSTGDKAMRKERVRPTSATHRNADTADKQLPPVPAPPHPGV